MALLAGEAVWMEFLPPICLEVLAFNASIAVGTERTVLLMVMASAVRIIVVNVEVGGLEGSPTGLADEALLVVTTSELSIRRTD